MFPRLLLALGFSIIAIFSGPQQTPGPAAGSAKPAVTAPLRSRDGALAALARERSGASNAPPAASTPAATSTPQLTQVEQLTFQNINLQLQLLNIQFQGLTQQVSREHPGWALNPTTGVLYPVKPYQPPAVPAPAPKGAK